jgi:uncharacterized protein
MITEYLALVQQAIKQKKENEKAIKKLYNKKLHDLDNTFHSLHNETFEQIDCLKCANCCSTTSPIFYDVDIARLSQHLRLKPAQFIANYLHIDADGDYVLNSAPCPFLGTDKYCSVYNARPKACREYPHTNRKNMYQITQLTYRNTMVCPAAASIVARIKLHYKL